NRCAAVTGCNDKMRRPLLRDSALREPEVANACSPVEAGSGVIILVRMKEGAVVHWIHSHVTIISPAAGSAGLAAGAVKKMLFTRQRVQWIGCQSACVADLWID